MQFLKRQLPPLIAFVFGTALWIQYFVPSRASQTALQEFTGSWVVIIAGAALILGVMSAVHYHSTKIRLKKPGYGYSYITLAAFATMATLGLLSRVPWWIAEEGRLGLVQVAWPGFPDVASGDNSPYMWAFHFVFFPLDATMFALLAFFIASAAFRAFRARSPEATALLIAAIILMIGRVPIGEMVTVFPPVAGRTEPFTMLDVSQFILNWPANAAQRGIVLGVILSQVAISLRIIFGIERTYMGGGED